MEEAKIFNAPLTIPAGPQGSIRVGKEGGNEEMKEDGFVVRPDVFNLENKRAGGCFFVQSRQKEEDACLCCVSWTKLSISGNGSKLRM